MTKPRPPFRYHGSKWTIAPWIIQFIPGHELYCEPYGGSASVLLRKPRSKIEVYNDLNSEVVNFFQVLREKPEQLVHSLELTPFAKEEFDESYNLTDDPIENARKFYVRSFMSIAGPTTQWSSGFRRQKVFSHSKTSNGGMTPAAITFSNPQYLLTLAERLKGVTIENEDAINLIERYDSPETLFYLDPPYHPKTLSHWKGKAYSHEMSEGHHLRLAIVLNALEGSAIISGYNCGPYEKYYSSEEGWTRFDKQARTNGPRSAIESIWLNTKAQDILNFTDLPLFQGVSNV